MVGSKEASGLGNSNDRTGTLACTPSAAVPRRLRRGAQMRAEASSDSGTEAGSRARRPASQPHPSIAASPPTPSRLPDPTGKTRQKKGESEKTSETKRADKADDDDDG